VERLKFDKYILIETLFIEKQMICEKLFLAGESFLILMESS